MLGDNSIHGRGNSSTNTYFIKEIKNVALMCSIFGMFMDNLVKYSFLLVQGDWINTKYDLRDRGILFDERA